MGIPEQQREVRTGRSRRAFLIGGISAAGAVAALAVGEWWLHSQTSQPASVPVDKHLICNLPLAVDPTSSYDLYHPNLEYAWLPDSAHIALAIHDGLFLVDVKTGQMVLVQKRPLETKNTLLVRWSADGQRINVVADDSIPGGGQIAWPGPYYQSYFSPSATYTLKGVFSSDETHLAYAISHQSSEVEVWNVQEKRNVATCQVTETATHPLGGNFAIAWSPNNTFLAVYPDQSSAAIQLWHALDGRLLWTSHPGGQAFGTGLKMKWSPDGRALAYAYTSDSSHIGVLDAQTGVTRFQTAMAQTSGEAIEEAFAWSPDGTRLAFCAIERGEPAIQVWQAKMGQHLFTCQRVQGSVGLVPTDNQYLYNGASTVLSWSPDGRYLVARALPDNKSTQALLQFWDAQNGKALFSYRAPYDDEFLAWTPKLFWSPDSRLLALYNVTSANCIVPSGFPGHPRCSYTYALQVFQVM